MTDHHVEQMQYTECFVAFIDVLGFKSLVKDSQSNPETIATLVRALNRIALDTPQSTFTKAKRDSAGNLLGYDTWVLQVRPFSDSICLFIPAASGRLARLLRSVRYIHDRMLELSVCIRGAITIGGMYWDDTWGKTLSKLQEELRDRQFKAFGQIPPQSSSRESPTDIVYQEGMSGFPVTLGPGLIEAYELESTKAIYPRVIASDSLVQYLDANGTSEAFPFTSPATDGSTISIRESFREDTDSIRFLDVLHEHIDRQDTERITRGTNSDGTAVWTWEHRTRSRSDIVALMHALADKRLSEDLSEAVHDKYKWLKNFASASPNVGPNAEASE
ncbi:MAG TPA: hypothetical protein PKN33_03770 [Phycisphaerae bacterium]|nr:hypothetical protein [Phycisphaerae bacterium]